MEIKDEFTGEITTITKDENTGGYIAIKNSKRFISHASLSELIKILTKLKSNATRRNTNNNDTNPESGPFPDISNR